MLYEAEKRLKQLLNFIFITKTLLKFSHEKIFRKIDKKKSTENTKIIKIDRKLLEMF